MSLSLLSFNNQVASGAVVNAVKLARPRAILVMDVNNKPYLEDLRAANPNMWVIARNYQFDGNYDGPAAYQTGQQHGEAALNIEANGFKFDRWTSINEPISDWEPNWSWYDSYAAGFYDTVGDRALAFNTATGNFPKVSSPGQFVEDDFDRFTQIQQRYHKFAFHAYGHPRFDANSVPWWIGRYQHFIHDPLAEIHLTEVGYHTVSGNPTPDKGYKYDGVTEDDYWNQMVWLDDFHIADPRVEDLCVFIVGGNSGWSSFEILGTSIIQRLADRNNELDQTIGQQLAAFQTQFQTQNDMLGHGLSDFVKANPSLETQELKTWLKAMSPDAPWAQF